MNLGRSHIGGAYHFDFNLSDKTLVQQRIGFFYNAQCCGVGIEYQAFNYPNLSRFIVSQGPPLQHLVHARRRRLLLQHPRRLRHRPGRDRHVRRATLLAESAAFST